jgi:hypothetical protein
MPDLVTTLAAAQAEQHRVEQIALSDHPQFQDHYSRSEEAARRQLMEAILPDDALRLYRARAAAIDEMRRQLHAT